MTNDILVILDERQAHRIEAVHRGFLYQHLYACGCLLLGTKGSANAIIVERDEDIEIDAVDERLYIQVKTRAAEIIPSDIDDALARFDKIRTEHAEGRRAGKAKFVIVVNNEPGPVLSKRIKDGSIPQDVTIEWPRHCGIAAPALLPPAWKNLSEAVQWCVAAAGSLPHTVLEPETLVWKLAGRVLLAATGDKLHPDHTFLVVDLPSLFEQLLIQLQDFPAPPSPYHPQEDEPTLDSERRVRIISGLSGAGKTTWASQAALFANYDCVYFDVGDIPGSALAANLVREVAAQRIKQPGGLKKILMPGNTGVESLRAMDAYFREHKFEVLVVIDNAHRLPAEDLRNLVEAASHIRFVFLCQPSPVVQELQTVLTVVPELLQGWGLDTIAAEIHQAGARANAITCERLRVLTGGLPLYVQSAVRLAVSEYGGEVANLCDAIETQTHVVTTAQEIILARIVNALPPATQDAIAVLSLSDVPLSDDEAKELLIHALSMGEPASARIIRSLPSTGILQIFGKRRLKIHDAARVIGLQHCVEFDQTKRTAAQHVLVNILVKSLENNRDTLRFPLLIRLFVEVGDIKSLVSIAQEEIFHELGIGGEIWPALEKAAKSTDIDPEQRFWALDGLVFYELGSGEIDKLPEHLALMEEMVKQYQLGNDEKLAFMMKQMLFSAKSGDSKTVLEFATSCAELLPDSPEHQRIFRYNTAHALWQLGDNESAEAITSQLIEEYYSALGLTFEDVVNKNCDVIWKSVKITANTTEYLKHLADTLELCARAVNAQGKDAGLMRLHATKFYNMCGAPRSLVRVGQDVADEFIKRRDFHGARWVMENLVIPAVIKQNMVAHMIPVRSQYAVILAYCGEHDAADAEMKLLDPYFPSLDRDQQDEIQDQRKIIARLRIERPQPIRLKDPSVRLSGALPQPRNRSTKHELRSNTSFCHHELDS